ALLAPLGQRWAHTLGVVERSRSFAGVLRDSEFEALPGAAYLHGIGYASALARTRFHPLDGARFLRSVGGRASPVHHASGTRLACCLVDTAGQIVEPHS